MSSIKIIVNLKFIVISRNWQEVTQKLCFHSSFHSSPMWNYL